MGIRILFVPVSSIKGMGEYQRSLNIATGLVERFSDIEIKFILNKQASYHQDCPFPTALTPTSPTRCNDLVNQTISQWRPDLVVFDASGRVAQLRHCHRLGIKTLFIAQHQRKLLKGLSWRRLRFTHRIWWVQPAFLSPKFGWWTRAKLALLKRPSPVEVGPIFPPVDQALSDRLLADFGLESNNYVLFNAGSGGHQLAGEDVATLFAQTAEALANTVSQKPIVVYGANFRGIKLGSEKLIEIEHLPAASFIALLSQARLALISGGGGLLQAMSLNVPVVAVAVAKDQKERIEACVKAYGVLHSELNCESMLLKLLAALDSPSESGQAKISSGFENALQDIKYLLPDLIVKK